MFEDSFLINLLIFVAGQIATWGYLRTGRVTRGVMLMIGGWVLGDAALLTRFVFQDAEDGFRLSLMALQSYSLVEVFLFVFGRLRRRLPALVRRRDKLFRDAFLHYLRNEHKEAQALYRQCLWNDPWDLDATLGLATVLARTGDTRRARAQFRAARALDRTGRYGDVISDELRRFSVRRTSKEDEPAEPTAPVAPEVPAEV